MSAFIPIPQPPQNVKFVSNIKASTPNFFLNSVHQIDFIFSVPTLLVGSSAYILDTFQDFLIA